MIIREKNRCILIPNELNIKELSLEERGVLFSLLFSLCNNNDEFFSEESKNRHKHLIIPIMKRLQELNYCEFVEKDGQIEDVLLNVVF